jgi:predicted aldo/keto reductase-like oxidoreductase
MKYRQLGKLGNEVSILGFGCMRCPTDEDQLLKRDESEAMLLAAIKSGVNYLDTAYPYHNGESELFVGEFLKKHNMRDKIFLATKLPSWLIHSKADMKKYITEQLEKLQVDYIDYFLLHALNKDHWQNYKDNGVFEFITEMIDVGVIKEIGFSFHDEYEEFEQIINEYDGWSFCQIQLNYMDEEYQAGLKGLRLAESKGIDVIVMEPLKGGNLTAAIPDDIQEVWDNSDVKRKPARWALEYVWQYDNVKLVLSGMSAMNQVTQNVETANAYEKGGLSDHDKAIISKVAEIYKSRTKVPCTACQYCMPCPYGVNIPEMFTIYNEGARFLNMDAFKWHYNERLKDANADLCTACGVCVEKCPQFIQIPDRLAEVKAELKY